MNLAQNPTESQLVELFAACDDKASHHVLWVNDHGEVEITPVPGDAPPSQFPDTLLAPRFWLEAFTSGEGFVGALASRNQDYVSRIYCDLRYAWRRGTRGCLKN